MGRGARYSSAVDISALVSDDASGVERVEYRPDNGHWRLLPVSNHSEGRYSTVWEPDRNVIAGETVTLDGSASHDPDGGPEPLTFTWGFVAVPDGSGITDNDLS